MEKFFNRTKVIYIHRIFYYITIGHFNFIILYVGTMNNNFIYVCIIDRRLRNSNLAFPKY